MKVLIAEDDENSRVLLESLLIGHGHAVTAAADGQEALERALLDPPDLIVTDLLMPRLDGFGVCRYVRGTPRLKAIPIVVYTATYTDRRDEALALALGADRFVVKPVEPEVLVAILHEVLADAARRRPARTSTQDTAATQALHIERVSTKLAEKVTDLERERAALREGEARFRDFAELAADFFWETDASLTVTFATGPYATAVGRPLPELLIGEQPDTGPGASATRLPHEWETVLTLRHAFHDWPVRRPRDETHFVLFSGKPYHDSEDRFAGYRGVGQDRTKTLDLEQRLTHLAKHDALTGLMNRTAFQRHMSNALAEARLRGTRHALCYLDLDQFKIVNDTAGHAAGDELLRQLTALLRERIAATDTLARLGGDEFALLLENRTQDQALAIAEDLAGLVREFRFVWAGRRYETGVSIGVAAVTAEADSVEDLLSRAHAACYSAKELGHHRVHHYEGSSRAEETYSELRRAAELPELLRQKRFCLYAQSIVPLALAGGRPHWEILLRSVDAAGQTVGAGPIITAAERFHVMPALDRWVIARALTQAQSVFGADSNTVIGINVSGQSFAEPGLADYVVACLRDSGVAPARVCFEITETAAVYHLAQASQFISALKNLGCLFALDDFGSGVSSFNYLKNLPVDFLKIDGSFVRNIVTDRIDRAMVAAMNEVGHMMGIRTVAEFVETPAIGEVLTGIGVDFGQGYAIGRPVPLDTLRET